MISRYRIATSLMVLLALAGCDTTDPESNGEASSEVTGTIEVPGEEPQDFSGTVYFAEGVDEETGMQGFGLYAEPNGDSDFDGSRAILFRFGDRPEPGIYEVVVPAEAAGGDFTGELQIESPDLSTTLSASSGELTIETSLQGRVEGSFTMEAQTSFGTVTITGTFDAGRLAGSFEVPGNRR